MASPIEVILVPTIMILLGVFLRQKGFLKKSDIHCTSCNDFYKSV